MADPISTALANFLIAAGFDAGLAGTFAKTILAGALTMVILITLELVINSGKGATHSGDSILIASLTLGIVLGTGLGWFDLWVPLFVVIMVLLILLKPFGGTSIGG
jgi:hypothetical protein